MKLFILMIPALLIAQPKACIDQNGQAYPCGRLAQKPQDETQKRKKPGPDATFQARDQKTPLPMETDMRQGAITLRMIQNPRKPGVWPLVTSHDLSIAAVEIEVFYDADVQMQNSKRDVLLSKTAFCHVVLETPTLCDVLPVPPAAVKWIRMTAFAQLEQHELRK